MYDTLADVGRWRFKIDGIVFYVLAVCLVGVAVYFFLRKKPVANPKGNKPVNPRSLAVVALAIAALFACIGSLFSHLANRTNRFSKFVKVGAGLDTVAYPFYALGRATSPF